jgi:hypothetical protein
MILLLALARMQLAALLILVLFATASGVLLPRELNFLRGVTQPHRRLFIAQDILLHFSIVLTLVPCAATSQLRAVSFTLVLAGFLLMWGTAIWAAAARYSYTYKVLLSQKTDLANRLKDILGKANLEDHSGE